MTEGDVARHEIAVGQMWSVKGSLARVVIGRIEPWKDGQVAVSVSITGAMIGPREAASFARATFERSALISSLDSLIVTDVGFMDFEAAYQKWIASGDLTLFTIGVTEAIASAFPTARA
jgi:hypothetical protein